GRSRHAFCPHARLADHGISPRRHSRRRARRQGADRSARARSLPGEPSMSMGESEEPGRAEGGRGEDGGASDGLVLQVTDLHAGYGEVPVLRGISFQLYEGEALGIVGHNGMGKTTLLKTIM